MRAKLIESEDFYKDIGLSKDESRDLEMSKNPFLELEKKISGFMNEDKIYFGDMVESFEKSLLDFLLLIIFNHLQKKIGIKFYKIEGHAFGLAKGNVDNRYYLILGQSYSGFSFYVALHDNNNPGGILTYGRIDQSAYSRSLHTLVNNIKKLLKEYNIQINEIN